MRLPQFANCFSTYCLNKVTKSSILRGNKNVVLIFSFSLLAVLSLSLSLSPSLSVCLSVIVSVSCLSFFVPC